MEHFLMVLFSTALALAVGGTADAKIWGYIDEKGKVHVSTSKVDDRYQIFFKGRAVLEGADTADRTPPHTGSRFRGGPRQAKAARFDTLIEQHAKSQRLDPALVKAVIAAESSFEPNAVSLKGAVGLMQITPDTAERYGVVGDATRSIEHKLRDPAINLRVGTRYLHDLLVLFAGDLELALAAYNAGESAVTRHDNTVPPFAETLEYVRLVQQLHSLYRPPPVRPKPVRIVVPRDRTAMALSGDAAE